MDDITSLRADLDRLRNHPSFRQIEEQRRAEDLERRPQLHADREALLEERQRHGVRRHREEPALDAEVARSEQMLAEVKAKCAKRKNELMAEGIRLDQMLMVVENRLRETRPAVLTETEAELAELNRRARDRFESWDSRGAFGRGTKMHTNSASVNAAQEVIAAARHEVNEDLSLQVDEDAIARRCAELLKAATKAVASIGGAS